MCQFFLSIYSQKRVRANQLHKDLVVIARLVVFSGGHIIEKLVPISFATLSLSLCLSGTLYTLIIKILKATRSNKLFIFFNW